MKKFLVTFAIIFAGFMANVSAADVYAGNTGGLDF